MTFFTFVLIWKYIFDLNGRWLEFPIQKYLNRWQDLNIGKYFRFIVDSITSQSSLKINHFHHMSLKFLRSWYLTPIQYKYCYLHTNVLEVCWITHLKYPLYRIHLNLLQPSDWTIQSNRNIDSAILGFENLRNK